MKQITTKKSLEISRVLEELTGECISIYKGAEDARYRDEYHAYARTWKGYAANGRYGRLIASGKTLKGLISDYKKNNEWR